MKNTRNIHFAVCINNGGYEASLELGKLYQIIPDAEADANDLIRVIDESGEDYAFTASRFRAVEMPLVVPKTLPATGR
jgi:hypothetical protein